MLDEEASLLADALGIEAELPFDEECPLDDDDSDEEPDDESPLELLDWLLLGSLDDWLLDELPLLDVPLDESLDIDVEELLFSLELLDEPLSLELLDELDDELNEELDADESLGHEGHDGHSGQDGHETLGQHSSSFQLSRRTVRSRPRIVTSRAWRFSPPRHCISRSRSIRVLSLDDDDSQQIGTSHGSAVSTWRS